MRTASCIRWTGKSANTSKGVSHENHWANDFGNWRHGGWRGHPRLRRYSCPDSTTYDDRGTSNRARARTDACADTATDTGCAGANAYTCSNACANTCPCTNTYAGCSSTNAYTDTYTGPNAGTCTSADATQPHICTGSDSNTTTDNARADTSTKHLAFFTEERQGYPPTFGTPVQALGLELFQDRHATPATNGQGLARNAGHRRGTSVSPPVRPLA